MRRFSACALPELHEAVSNNELLSAQVVLDMALQQQGLGQVAVLRTGMSLALILTWILSWLWHCACPCKRSARARRLLLLPPMLLRQQLQRVSQSSASEQCLWQQHNSIIARPTHGVEGIAPVPVIITRGRLGA